MCGINGFYNYSGRQLPAGDELIVRMNKVIRHRGPDNDGAWNNPSHKLFFGHQRLSIIDLSDLGHQPMINSTGEVIVFNGEIYNFRECQNLIKNHTLKSESDTEVLLNLYAEMGPACLEHLNGMFAFSIWNSKEETLFLARDQAGEKPLYYSTINGVFAFSSEIRALLQLPWIQAELDDEALYHFLTFNHLPPPMTMFKNIFKFHPGYKMIVNKNGIAEYEPYWNVKYMDLPNENPGDLQGLVLDNLQKAVDYRMVSDVPVGAFLSGGVDSSAIVSLMSKSLPYPVKTYSIGFKDQPGYDELPHARKVARLCGTDHYEKIVEPRDIEEFLPKIVEIFDEPLADATCIPIYFISEMARKQDTKVVLSGDGADELFAGYSNWMNYSRAYPFYNAYSRLPNFLKSAAWVTYDKLGRSSRAKEILFRASKGQEFFWGGAKSFKESTKRNVLHLDFNKRIEYLNSHDVIQAFRVEYDQQSSGRTHTYVDWMCYLGFKYIVPNLYMHRADRLGMAHSIEIRAPFLDKEMVNMALSIPSDAKIAKGEPKAILKQALEKILPNEVLYRKKQGFCVPLNEWGGEIMVDYIADNLKQFCNDTGLFSFDALNQILERQRKDTSGSLNDLWTLYFLMNWFKKWL